MNSSLTKMRDVARAGLLVIVALWAGTTCGADNPGDKSLAQQIFETMIQLPGSNPAFRAAHAKGVVCQGTFTASKDAAGLSRQLISRATRSGHRPLLDRVAGSFHPDNASNPRGMAIRFVFRVAATPTSCRSRTTGSSLVLVKISGSAKAIVATDPSKPHPWPVRRSLPRIPSPRSLYRTQAVPSATAPRPFSNDAFIFVDARSETRRPLSILPVAGLQNLSEADAKAKAPIFSKRS